MLHFRRFAQYVAAFWRIASSSSRSASWRLRRCNLGRHLQFTFRRRLLILLFTAPVVELCDSYRLSSRAARSNTDAFSKLQGFTAKFQAEMLFTGVLLVDTVLSCRSPLTEVLLLGRVSTIASGKIKVFVY